MDNGPKVAALLAAQRLARSDNTTETEHFKAVVKFACRGAGKRGKPAFAAELADPYATSNLKYFEPLSKLLVIIYELLKSGNAIEFVKRRENENTECFAEIGEYKKRIHAILQHNSEVGISKDDLLKCLFYLRDRTGIPRDMAYFSALLFRGHINFVAKIISDFES